MAIVVRDITEKKLNILIIGAGEAGQLVLDEIKNHPSLNFKIIGFIDDDSKKQNKKINGIFVLGKVKDIPRLARSKNIKEVIIAIPSASGLENRRIINKCQEAKLPFRIIPGIYEMLKRDTDAGSLRDVELEDIIKRKPVDFDLESIELYLTNRTVLISGAAGSIGRELCNQVVKFNPKKLLLFDHEENALNETFNELKKDFSMVDIVPIVGSIRDKNRIKAAFDKFKPDVVFHSAAYKHVPMMELNVSECIKNNVFGTLNIVAASARKHTKRFIFISTDKAVNPTSIMGASKRIAELIVQDYSKISKTKFSIVRFGNVLVSRGSVVPIFEKQIKNRQPVTITHKKMYRYFMTLPEAAQLVIQAGALSRGGEVFVLDMGKPVRIVNLAKEIIRLSGLTPDKDIPIVYTGVRPGERLREPLFSSKEKLKLTKHKRIFIAPYFSVNHKKLFSSLARLRKLVDSEKKVEIIKEIKKLVPGYKKAFSDNKRIDARWRIA